MTTTNTKQQAVIIAKRRVAVKKADALERKLSPLEKLYDARERALQRKCDQLEHAAEKLEDNDLLDKAGKTRLKKAQLSDWHMR